MPGVDTRPGGTFLLGQLLVANEAVLPVVHHLRAQGVHSLAQQLACLLRAVHCGAQESFLGKVRMRIASLYVAQGEPGRARCHLDRVAACYQRQGWHLPLEVREMLGFVCAGGTPPDACPGSDFMEVTNGILARGCQECVAVVTHVDEQARRVAIVYGQERRTALRKKDISGRGVKVGTFLRVLVSGEDPVRVVQASVMDAPVPGLPYVKRVKGIVRRVPEKSFAFVRAKGVNCFLHPALVAQNQLAEGERVSVLAAFDLDRKTGKWGWAGLVLLGREQDTGQQGQRAGPPSLSPCKRVFLQIPNMRVPFRACVIGKCRIFAPRNLVFINP